MTADLLHTPSPPLEPPFRPPRPVAPITRQAAAWLTGLLLALPLALPVALPVAVRAQAAPPAAPVSGRPVPGLKQSESGPVAVSAPVEGEVRKVERNEQKLTLNHAPIPNLEIDETTKEFRVADPVMLEDVKPGDRVRFTVERANGALTVTALEPLRDR